MKTLDNISVCKIRREVVILFASLYSLTESRLKSYPSRSYVYLEAILLHSERFAEAVEFL